MAGKKGISACIYFSLAKAGNYPPFQPGRRSKILLNPSVTHGKMAHPCPGQAKPIPYIITFSGPSCLSFISILGGCVCRRPRGLTPVFVVDVGTRRFRRVPAPVPTAATTLRPFPVFFSRRKRSPQAATQAASTHCHH